jgi:ribonuclease HI
MLEDENSQHNKQRAPRRLKFGIKVVINSNAQGFEKYARRAPLEDLEEAIEDAVRGRGTWVWCPNMTSLGQRRRPPSRAFTKATSPPTQGTHPPFITDHSFEAATMPMQPHAFPNPKDIAYTDGSKKGTSVTGAIVQEAEGIEVSVKMQDHAGQLNTCLHGELGAIHQCLTTMSGLRHRTSDTLMTDSQTALDLISIGLRAPERLRVNKHRDILLQIAQMAAAWPRQLHMHKVRAHVDIRGNTQADKLANKAHTEQFPQVFAAAGEADHGQHWFMYTPRGTGGAAGAPEPWAVNNLKGHVLALATAAHGKQILHDSKHFVIKQINHLLEHDGGIATNISNAFWWHRHLTSLEMHNAMHIRCHRLYTKCRDARWAGTASAVLNAICPLCKRSADDAQHALG